MKRLLRNLLACMFLASPAAQAEVPEPSPDNPPVPCDHCACYDWGSAKLSINANPDARKQTGPGDGDDLNVVPDAEGRIKLILAVTMNGTGECCTDIGVVARITDAAGKILDVSGLTIDLQEREWTFPLDIRYYVKKDSVSTVPADAIPCAKFRVTKGDCESGCYEVCMVTADPSGSVSSVKFTVPVGVSKFGDQEAFIEAHFDTLPNPGRSALKLVSAPEITATVDGIGMTSVATDSMKATIANAGTVTDPNRYIITLSSDPSNPGTSQFRTITVESPTANSLKVSTTFAGSTRVMEWTRTIPVAGTEIWTFTDGNGLRKVENTKTLVDPNTREERVKTYERSPTNSAVYLMTSDRKLTYSKFFHRWELVQEAVDPTAANLRSYWAYGWTGEGAGLLGSFNRYDGYYENHYHSYNPFFGIYSRWTDSPFKDGLTTRKESTSWTAASEVLSRTTQIGTTVIALSETIYTSLSKTVKVYSDASNFTTSVTTYKDPAAGLGLGGKIERVIHPDRTLTTYSYGFIQAPGNGPVIARSTTIGRGAPNANSSAVIDGTSTTTQTNLKGRVYKSETIAVPAAGSMLDEWFATGIDAYGRITQTQFFPSNAGGPSWTTSVTYNCCGVGTETDRYGVTTTYTYDDLKRRVTSTRSGVTTHTVYAGLATDTHRYAGAGSPVTGNRIARQTRTLPGTTTTSFAPLASSLFPGAIVATSTSTTYQPDVGLSSRTVTTVPGGFTQTTDAYLDGRTATTTGALQPAVTYNYNPGNSGFVTVASYPGFESTTTTTDLAGRTVEVTSGGATTTHAYNLLGQLESITDPDNVRTLFAYNSRGERTTTALDTDIAGAGVGAINYGGMDQITVTESTPGTYLGYGVMTTTTKVYAANNNATATTVSTSHQTHDGLRSWTITPGVANPATHVINKTTWSQTSTAPDGTYSVSTINGDVLPAAVEHYSAGSPGTLVTRVDYTYDALKRPFTTIDSRTGTTTTTYVSTTCDAVRTVTDPGGRVTSFTYDSRGRRITTTLPDATVAHTSYYPHNQVKATWGTQSYPTFLTYDYAHRRKELHTWRTAPVLSQTTATPPAGSSVTTWNYSPVTGYLTSKKDAATKGAEYEYTNAGRLWKRTWARGGTTTYTYTAGRLTNTDYPAGTPDVTTQYNRLGQPRFVTQTAQSEIEYTYDPATFALDTEIVRYDLDQSGNFADPADQTRTLDRSLDTLGRSNGWQLKDSLNNIENRADYTFDTAGRLSTVADATNTFTYGYLYTQTTAADPRVGTTTTTGSKQDFMPYTLTKGGTPVLQTVRTYEARRDALAVIANTAGGTARSSYTYTVNAIGQRTGLTTSFNLGVGVAGNPGETIWLYDSLGQLESADAPETEPSADADRYFQYDSIGNRKLSRTDTPINSLGTLTEYFDVVDGTPPQPGGNNLNQYERIAKAGTTLEPVHDDDGNATSYPLPSHNSLSALAWDAENRLTSVTVNGVPTSYRYDALSRRIAKITGGVTTLYRYDGWNCIAEYTDSTTLSEIRTWGLDLSGSGQGAGGVGGLLAEKTGGNYYYPTFDGNGNVSEYLNANGDTIAHFEYDPFGNTVVNAGSVSLFNYRFSTKPLDFETGLFYYGYRYLDPVTGRWPSRDPIGEQGGVNLYGFVGNGALSKVDFLGKDAVGEMMELKRKAREERESKLTPEERKEREEREHARKEYPVASWIDGHPVYPKGHGCFLANLRPTAFGNKTAGVVIVTPPRITKLKSCEEIRPKCYELRYEVKLDYVIYINPDLTMEQRRKAYGHEQLHVIVLINELNKFIDSANAHGPRFYDVLESCRYAENKADLAWDEERKQYQMNQDHKHPDGPGEGELVEPIDGIMPEPSLGPIPPGVE